MKLTPRQEEIVKLVKEGEPVTSETLATKLGVTRAALRPDLAILTMIGILDARPKVGYVYCEGNKTNILYEEIMNSKVLDIMSKPITVTEETMVYDAIVHLFLNDVGTMFVENKGDLVGAVSRKDFLKIAIGGTDIYKVPVGIIMTRMPNIIYALEDETAYNVAKRIIEHEIDSDPVVRKLKDDLGKEKLLIVGKISKTNITRLFVNLGNY